AKMHVSDILKAE
ncbi:ftsX-like permease family protein, partial [Chlamydia psittaci 06-1683]